MCIRDRGSTDLKEPIAVISETEFKLLSARGYNRIPLQAQAFADLETPLSLYLKLTQNRPYSFLLESVVGGERFGRYSFIGPVSYTHLDVYKRQVKISKPNKTNPPVITTTFPRKDFRKASMLWVLQVMLWMNCGSIDQRAVGRVALFTV